MLVLQSGLGLEEEEGEGLRIEEEEKGVGVGVGDMVGVLARYEERVARGSYRGLLSSKKVHRRKISRFHSVASMGMDANSMH